MALRDQPYLPLYVQDFMTDEKLVECSAAATGVYIRIMCIMHKSEQYGKVLLKQKDQQTGKPVSDFALKIGRLLPYNLHEIESALRELVSEGVLTIEGDCLYQKRMVSDSELSIKRAAAGKKGGRKTHIIASNFAKTKDQANTEYEIEYENDNKDEEIEMGAGEEKIFQPVEVEVDALDFENAWNLYGKKGNKKTSAARWTKLSTKTKNLALEHISKYVQSTPDILYRKNFETYINQEAWNDKIIINDERSENTNSRSALSSNEKRYGSTSATKRAIIAEARELDRRRTTKSV